MLSNLHALDATCGDQCDLDLLVAALQHCTALTHLTLDKDTFAQAHLAAVLPSMPLLTELHLHSTMKNLNLGMCCLSAAEIRFLQQLRSLGIHQCFVSPLDAFTLLMLTPGSESFMHDWWPNLLHGNLAQSTPSVGSSTFSLRKISR